MKLHGFNGEFIQTQVGQQLVGAISQRFAAYTSFMETTDTAKSLNPETKNILQNNL